MNPNQPSNDGYAPKYRQFHPQSTVWVQNPFDRDVVFQVADEHNNAYQYKIGPNATAELPGGAVATLGVKAIVDELIQNSKEDVLRIWDKDVRAKHEDRIILRVKEAAIKTDKITPSGEIDLSVNKENNVEDEPIETASEEVPFPDIKTKRVKNEVANIAEASLAGKKNAVVESD